MSDQQTLTIRRPDDWHVHLRDGAMMQAVLPYTASVFSRAIIMPNLVPPVTTMDLAAEYRSRIQAANHSATGFTPLMVCYLTNDTDPDDIASGFKSGVFSAAKLYPAGATTNSASGVTDIAAIYPVLEVMQKIGMPLLIHGEVTDADIDIFDREKVFIDRTLRPLAERFTGLKIVMEHITTADAVAFLDEQEGRLGATITPHHMMLNRTDIFRGGIRPHHYCLPIAKREQHRLAVRAAATSGKSWYFLGTDTAPHDINAKEAECGCAGIFNAPAALELYTQVFDEDNALDKLQAFASENGPNYYGLPLNEGTVTLVKTAPEYPDSIRVDNGDKVKVFAPDTLTWRVDQVR